MTHKLIHTPDYLLVVDNSEIKEGNWVYDVYDGIVRVDHKYQLSNIMVFRKDCKKIIAHLPLNGSSILTGVDLLPPLEDEVEELAKSAFTHPDFGKYKVGSIAYYNGYKEGYNKAKEKFKFTEEDMINAVLFGMQKGLNVVAVPETDSDWVRNYIQSLSQPKMPIGFECEIEKGAYLDFDAEYKFYEAKKVVFPSEGHCQWVGKYIY